MSGGGLQVGLALGEERPREAAALPAHAAQVREVAAAETFEEQRLDLVVRVVPEHHRRRRLAGAPRITRSRTDVLSCSIKSQPHPQFLFFYLYNATFDRFR